LASTIPPSLFLGYNFDYRQYFMSNILPRCSGLMVNTYYVRSRYVNMFSIRQKLKFRGLIFTDSGGFQHAASVVGRKNPVTRYTQDQVLRDQIDLGSDFAAALDYPLDPGSGRRVNMARIRKSLLNVERAVTIVQSAKAKTIVVPVLHGYDRRMIRFGVEHLEKLEEELSYRFPLIGIGSLVPLYVDRSITGGLRLIEAFKGILEFVPKDKIIHVMGAGSPLSMRFYYWLGARSLDTRSWVTNAMFGKLVMPNQGTGRVHISTLIRRFGRRAQLCKCPICKNIELGDLARSRMKRAAHNAFAYLHEFKRIQREFQAGTFEETTRRLLERKIYFRRILEHAPRCQ
jgi:tRNA-guanine family transglycosylase